VTPLKSAIAPAVRYRAAPSDVALLFEIDDDDRSDTEDIAVA
jgi:hypothetical protein